MSEQPVIKVWDVAFPRLQVPDLDRMEAFLLDFGMLPALRTDDTLYMRGTGTAPFVHVSHLGEPGFRGFALQAASRDDLDTLAACEGFSAVQRLDSPGGGWRVYATDPAGMTVEVVWGIEPVEPDEDGASRALNVADRFERLGEPQRIPAGPSRIKRFGHLAVNVPDPDVYFAWYHRHFGLIVSDGIELAPGMPIGMFVRCDRGDTPTDHHTMLIASNMGSGGVTGLNHVSWEVCDIDDVFVGHAHMAAKNRAAEWGIGRHLLGSQIFDYWNDPWGHIHEHWTDGDQFDASVPPGKQGLAEAAASQWGPDVPQSFTRTSAEVVK